jgi:hypothetical protein
MIDALTYRKYVQISQELSMYVTDDLSMWGLDAVNGGHGAALLVLGSSIYIQSCTESSVVSKILGFKF